MKMADPIPAPAPVPARITPYLWQLHFEDGSLLNQRIGDDARRQWNSVDALLQFGGRIARIVLVSQIQGLPDHVISVPAGANALAFRRAANNVKVTLNTDTGEVEGEDAPPDPDIVCAGWEFPPMGEYVEGTPLVGCYLFAFHDGSCVLTSDREEVNH
jgi:hypothetical protein